MCMAARGVAHEILAKESAMEIKDLKKTLANVGIAGLIAGVGLFSPGTVSAGSG